MVSPASVFDLFKFRPTQLAALAISCGVFLFSTQSFKERLHVANLAEHYCQAIGVVFIGASSLLLVSVLKHSVWVVWDAMAERKAAKAYFQQLHRLSDEEREILWLYISKKTKSCMFNSEDGVVEGLHSKGLIYIAFLTSTTGKFPYNIDERVWDYLHEHQATIMADFLAIDTATK